MLQLCWAEVFSFKFTGKVQLNSMFSWRLLRALWDRPPLDSEFVCQERSRFSSPKGNIFTILTSNSVAGRWPLSFLSLPFHLNILLIACLCFDLPPSSDFFSSHIMRSHSSPAITPPFLFYSFYPSHLNFCLSCLLHMYLFNHHHSCLSTSSSNSVLIVEYFS